MSTYSDRLDSQSSAPPVSPLPRPFYWSVRRELWENRSIWMAPLLVTALVLFSTLVSTHSLPKKMQTLSTLEPAKQHSTLMRPFHMAPAPIMFATLLVGLWFSLDALYGERRDRSILFWKSLPVSDTTAVLAKASIPMVVLPALATALGILTVFALLVASSVVLIGRGLSPARLWVEYGVFTDPVIMFYGMTVHALWLAPIYAWLLMVSAWAKRAPMLWAVIPPASLMVMERLAGNSRVLASYFGWRWTGAMQRAFATTKGTNHDIPNFETLDQLTPLRFLSTPGLWGGLVVAALFLAAAIRLRRAREPI